MIDYKDINVPEGLDYEALKQYGLDYVKAVGGKMWSDFNVHDPGVTILEALGFALTDLSFRTSFKMKDYLTKKGSTNPELSGSLFPAHEILSFNPCTLEDYRKYILENVPGVRDVSFSKKAIPIEIFKGERNYSTTSSYVRGYYDVIVEAEGKEVFMTEKVRSIIGRDVQGRYADDYYKGNNYRKYLSHYIKNFLLKHRNLCEDFDKVIIREPVHFYISAAIEVAKGTDCHKLLQTIYDRLNEYVSPAIKYHTLESLVKAGKKPEEIYGGELPRYGFIDREELRNYKRKDTLYVSDIKNILMKIDGVKSIKGLTLDGTYGCSKTDYSISLNNPVITRYNKYYSWHLSPFFLNRENYYAAPSDLFPEDFMANMDAPSTDTVIPVFTVGDNGYLSVSPTQTPFNRVMLIRSSVPTVPTAEEAAVIPCRSERKSLEKGFNVVYPMPESKYRDTGSYISFQNLFPKAYKMGAEGISERESDLRKASRLQLKAYLTFFDKVMADYLAQLDNLVEWFSIDESPTLETNTYFHHQFTDSEIVDVSKVLDQDSGQIDVSEKVNMDRKSRLMDSLLARFCDSFVDYAALSYLCAGTRYDSAMDVLTEKEALEDKKRLLRSIPEITGRRAQAIDYTERLYVSGIEKRILHKLGINNPEERYKLAPERIPSTETNDPSVVHFIDNSSEPYDQTFGLHIIDHIMLVPENGIKVNPQKPKEVKFLRLSKNSESLDYIEDPYSFTVTVILPGWLDISKNLYFRQFVEETVRQELPAHIVAKFCWLDPYYMDKAEKAYKKLLKALAARAHPSPDGSWYTKEIKAIDKVLEVFDDMCNLYPSATLGTDDNFAFGDLRLDFTRVEDWEVMSGKKPLWCFVKKDNTNKYGSEE